MRSPWQSPGRAPWDSPRKGHFVTAVTSWVPSHSGLSIPVHPHVSPWFWGTGEPPDGSGGGIPPGQGGTWCPSAPETRRMESESVVPTPGIIYSHAPQNSAHLENTVDGKNPALFYGKLCGMGCKRHILPGEGQSASGWILNPNSQRTSEVQTVRKRDIMGRADFHPNFLQKAREFQEGLALAQASSLGGSSSARASPATGRRLRTSPIFPLLALHLCLTSRAALIRHLHPPDSFALMSSLPGAAGLKGHLPGKVTRV